MQAIESTEPYTICMQTVFPGLTECNVEMLDSDRESHSPSLSFSPMPSPSATVSRFLRGGVDGAWVHISLVCGLGTPPPPPFATIRASRRDAVSPVEQTQGRFTQTSKILFSNRRVWHLATGACLLASVSVHRCVYVRHLFSIRFPASESGCDRHLYACD